MKFRRVENGNVVFFEVDGEPCSGITDINGCDIYHGDTVKAYPKSFTGQFNRDGYHVFAKCLFRDNNFFAFEIIPVSVNFGLCIDGFSHAFEIIGDSRG